MKVCMFVYNNMKHDSRVLKEAKTLAEAGYDVRVIALLDTDTTPYELLHGFRLIRVVKNPLHYRLLRAAKPPYYKALRGTKTLLLFFVKPLLWLSSRVLNRPRKLLDRYSIHFKGNILNELIAKLKRPFQKMDQEIKAKGIRGYVREAIRARPITSLALGWIRLLGYCIYCCARRVLPGGIRRCTKVTCRYIKKTLRWGLYYPANKLGCLFYVKLKSFLMIPHRPFSFSDYYSRSIKLVRKEPADIYHAHDLNTLPVAYWAKKKMGGKLVYDSHELYVETSGISSLEKLISKILERVLIRRSNRVITVNRSIANELAKRYKVPPPTVIMNCPKIDCTEKTPGDNPLRRELGLDSETPLILYQGGYSPNRGLQNLIMSAHYLSKVIIVLMGWGKLEQELKDLTKTEGLSERVRFTPPVSTQELLYYTASATLGVIPYQFVGLNNYYSSPNKLFEYMAAGLPVAGSDFPELKKVIEGYKLGKTFNPDEPEDIAEAINYVLSDKERYNEMKKNALRAAKVFNWENESRKLLEIYKRLEDESSITSNQRTLE